MAKRRGDPLNDWMTHLPQEFVTCRDLGHSWVPYRAWRDSKEREYVQVLRCSSCRTERHRRIDYRGNRSGNSYEYPDDYTAPAGTGVLSAGGRADLRLLAIQRFIEDSPEGEVVDLKRKRKAG